jgi:hypothetical protein
MAFRPAAAAAVVAICAVVAACGGAGGSAARSAAPVLSTLSGKPVTSADESILAIKVENTAAARPQTGLSAADIVYVEQVEGGITRLAAVYSSTLPEMVGPIRSARITDVDLLAQFGHVAFAYSGAQSKMTPVLNAANLTLLREVRNDAWVRATDRSAPHNLFGVPARLLDSAKQKSSFIATARDMGWVFDTVVPAGGAAVRKVRAPFPAEDFIIRWDSEQWNLQSGDDPIVDGGVKVSPATVIVQFVVQQPSQFHGYGGSVTPKDETIGSGTAVMLRDGQLWQINWSRSTADAATAYTNADGTPARFAPGGLWVMLMDKSRSVSVSYAPDPASAAPSTAAP